MESIEKPKMGPTVLWENSGIIQDSEQIKGVMGTYWKKYLIVEIGTVGSLHYTHTTKIEETLLSCILLFLGSILQ